MILGTRTSRIRYLVLAAAACAAFAILGPGIPQDQNYHRFAGPSPWPTTLSNLPFVLIGSWWLWKSRWLSGPVAAPFRVAAAGVLLTGFGSAYYHLAPDDARLVWDRIPMTIVFMSVFAVLLDRWAGLTHAMTGRLWSLVAFGIASVLWWRFTGDLKVYALVQFVPLLLAVPAMITDHRARGLWRAFAAYAAAKIFEMFDVQIYNAIGFSGHSLKHLAAALAAYWILQWISIFSGMASPNSARHQDATSIAS